MLCFKPVILNEHQVSEAVPSAVAQMWLWRSLVIADKKSPWKCLGLIFWFLFRYGFVNLNTSSTLTHFSLVLRLKENKHYGSFFMNGVQLPEGYRPLQGGSLFHTETSYLSFSVSIWNATIGWNGFNSSFMVDLKEVLARLSYFRLTETTMR